MKKSWEVMRGQCEVSRRSWEFCAILGNPQIFSAMAMAMSIYKTLCILVYNAAASDVSEKYQIWTLIMFPFCPETNVM